jgi:hypothetical protein
MLRQQEGKVTSLYASEGISAEAWKQKLGKSLKPHLAKQKKQELEETRKRCM